MKKALTAVLLLILAGCEKRPEPAQSHAAINQVPSSRFSVTIDSEFRDELAYNKYRAIYLIKDNVTGAEYVGVSGVGISETGHHREGNSDREHEQ